MGFVCKEARTTWFFLLGSFYPHTWRRKVRPRVVRPRGVMVWLEGGNLHLPEHPTEPQVESARLAAIHLGWIRELMRRNVQNLGAAGRTAPSHINAQPFLRGDTPRIARRTLCIVSPNRWIVSPSRVGLQHKRFQLLLQMGEPFLRGIALAKGRRGGAALTASAVCASRVSLSSGEACR